MNKNIISMSKNIFSIKTVFSLLWILTTLFIFSNSLMVGEVSSNNSSGISQCITNFLNSLNFNVTLNDVTIFVRKSAHFCEYALLSIIISLCFNSFKIKLSYLWQKVLFFGLLTAVFDEFIQSFIAGRSSEVKDVLIDFSGIIFGFLVFLFIITIINIISKKRKLSQ
ncbi:MAG: VanZ family protein [Clostridia bacterium]